MRGQKLGISKYYYEIRPLVGKNNNLLRRNGDFVENYGLTNVNTEHAPWGDIYNCENNLCVPMNSMYHGFNFDKHDRMI